MKLKSRNTDYSFSKAFDKIISDYAKDYDREKTAKENLKSFLEDVQHGGCISGMIRDFVYHSDCKDFYIEHIDDLEEFKAELEESIKNRHEIKHYTFVVWLCFEEYCYDIYNNMFED